MNATLKSITFFIGMLCINVNIFAEPNPHKFIDSQAQAMVAVIRSNQDLYDENPELRKQLSKIQSRPERKQLQRDVMRKVRHNQQKPNKQELKIKKILTDAKLIFNPEQNLKKFFQSSNEFNFGMFVNVPFFDPELQRRSKETDFLIPPNKIIEHNGTYDHADPRQYSADSKIHGKTAEQIWKDEKMKLHRCEMTLSNV